MKEVVNVTVVCYLIAEKFELQTNELYGASLTTKCHGAQNRCDDLQEGKESREMSTRSLEQTQSSEDLELKSNEAYITFQITTVDNEAYGQIATKSETGFCIHKE